MFYFWNFIPTFVAILLVLIAYYKWVFLYWHREKIPFLPPQIPFGNCYEAITGKVNWAILMKNFYTRIKKNGWNHGGIYVFTSPNYLPTNLDYIKNILSTDFQYFTDRVGYHNPKDPFTNNLFSTGGFRWQKLRPKLTSAFSSYRIKKIFRNLEDKQSELLKKIEEKRLEGPLNVKEIFFCFTLDIIGSWAFGIHLNNFREEATSFKLYAKNALKLKVWQRLLLTFVINFPNLALKLNIHMVAKDTEDFFVTTVKDAVNFREESKESRNDFLQLILDMKNGDKEESRKLFSRVEDITAQCFVFVIAGFETSTSLMTFTLFELARNPHIQEKLRDEIKTVLAKYDQNINPDSIQEMKYLSQVINESLRMYPPLPLINRKCVKDYKIPDEDIIIKKDTIVIISIMGIHYDEELYPDPEKFDPERFNEEHKSLRHKYAFIPFGGGPRTCIGMQMGLLQVKMGLACVLRDYAFSVNEKTSVPLKMKPNHLNLRAVGGIWLNAEKIE